MDPARSNPLFPCSTSTRNLTGFDPADFDGDGDLDFVACSPGADELVVIENLGDGDFRGRKVIASGLERVRSAKAADMDGDGDLDVVAGSYDFRDAKASVHWLENNGAGSFAAPVELMSNGADGCASVSLWDFDRDGDLDVLAEYPRMLGLGADRAAVWIRNDDGGKFEALPLAPIGEYAPSVPIDVDGDSDLDLVALETFQRKAYLNVHGTKAGALGEAQPLDVMNSPGANLAASDFDGDGHTDLLVIDGSEVKVYHGAGGSGGVGLGAASTLVTLGQPATDIALLDLDADGDDDLVTHSPAAGTWFENLGSGLIGPAQAITGWSRKRLSSRLGAADLDGDGGIDLYRELSSAFRLGIHSGLVIHLSVEQAKLGRGLLGTVNSTGRTAHLTVGGRPSVSGGDLLMTASSMPARQVGYFVTSNESCLAAEPVGAPGGLCVRGQWIRTPRIGEWSFVSSPNGNAFVRLVITNPSSPKGSGFVMAGGTRCFQGWFRDANSAASSQLTGGLHVTFLP